MTCFSPVKGYRSRDLNSKGNRSIVFSHKAGYIDLPLQVPCGRCTGCLLDRAKNWAVRCVHEASLYKSNCFLTLTYAPEKMPLNGSLRPRDFVLFMKRLRKKFGKVRYFQCGEYGEYLKRPHHHCIIFGWEPTDKSLWSVRGEVKLYRSPSIEELWGHGYITVGNVTYESAAYIARYVLKKNFGTDAENHYQGKVKEYITMSRFPGIGKKWLEKFSSDVYKTDKLHYGLGKLTKPPKYYDKVYEKLEPDHFKEIKKERIKREENAEYNEVERIKAREQIVESNLKNLERQYHKEVV